MKLLKPGDTGPYVEYLSLALERAGFSTGGNSNDFNSRVYNSVIAFQNSVGITADGVVGENTWNALLPYLRGYRMITTVKGDTLSSVADKYSSSINAIKTANPFVFESVFMEGTELIVPYNFPVVPDNVNYSYFLVSLIIEGLKARFPFAETGVAGESVMGQRLYYLAIGNGTTEVFANASHHANEWITTPVLLKYAEDYLTAVSNGEFLDGFNTRTLFETKKLYLMPLVNPDGVDLVTGALEPDNPNYISARSIAAEYPSISFPDGWKANIEGTDLNLNYPAGWINARRIKEEQGFSSPAPRDFVGTSPLSATESRAVYNFTLSHNFVLTLSFHTQGEVIYWKYLNYLPPRSEEIGNALASASGYTLETTPYASGFAGYKDWYISYYNLPGYTIEIGSGQNPLPISDFANIYPTNRRLITTALDMA